MLLEQQCDTHLPRAQKGPWPGQNGPRMTFWPAPRPKGVGGRDTEQSTGVGVTLAELPPERGGWLGLGSSTEWEESLGFL